jgi:hypothetical protein
MPERPRYLVLVILLLALSGCARWVIFGHTYEPKAATPVGEPNAQPGPSRSPLRVAAVTLTAEVREKASADPRFKEGGVLTAIESELRADGFLADEDAKADRAVTVVIDDFNTRPATNAVVFGSVISEATLAGNVEVHAASGRMLQAFRIEAKSRLVTPASGADEQGLRKLYGKFAEEVVAELSGIPRKPDDVTNSEAPRF